MFQEKVRKEKLKTLPRSVLFLKGMYPVSRYEKQAEMRELMLFRTGTGTISGGHKALVAIDGSPISTRTIDSGGRETSERGHPIKRDGRYNMDVSRLKS